LAIYQCLDTNEFIVMENRLPLVSIITPSFNRADIIDETAQSIFNQTYPHWEWIIVEDGSTDNSWEILQQYAANDKRVKIFKRNREPKGANACRNIGTENCSGQYLVFIDTDDLLASFCLEQRVNAALQNPEADFIIFPSLLFKKQPDDLKLLWNIDSDEDEVNRLLSGNPCCQGTGLLWKKESFVRVGMFDEKLLLWQDIELHLRAYLNGLNFKKRFDLLPDLFIRISDISLSRTAFHSLPKLNSRIAVLAQTVNLAQQKGLMQQYRAGMRNMFCNIFIAAAGSNHFSKTKELLQLQKNWQLFKANEEKYFRQYQCMRKFKLYKIPALQNNLYQKLMQFNTSPKDSIGQIAYNKPINF